jgi:hypothetical protein
MVLLIELLPRKETVLDTSLWHSKWEFDLTIPGTEKRLTLHEGGSWDRSVDVVIRLRAGRTGFDSRRGLQIFLLATASIPALAPTQPPVQWVSGVLSKEVKQPGREADHSPTSSAEVKNAWSCTSTSQYVFMSWCLVKHRDSFIFTLLYCTKGFYVYDHICEGISAFACN